MQAAWEIALAFRHFDPAPSAQNQFNFIAVSLYKRSSFDKN